jgi:hypothetical protein
VFQRGFKRKRTGLGSPEVVAISSMRHPARHASPSKQGHPHRKSDFDTLITHGLSHAPIKGSPFDERSENFTFSIKIAFLPKFQNEVEFFGTRCWPQLPSIYRLLNHRDTQSQSQVIRNSPPNNMQWVKHDAS